VPVVDAGMRELVATGYMHNRARMAVASFLSKHLLIDWRRGEQFFARHLVDYDPAVNNGNWQWSASVGLDSIPIRMFNPYTQAEKYDKGAEYVTTWVPELRAADPDRLTSGDPVDLSDHDGYPPPIVDHYDAYHRATDAYEAAQAEAKRRDEPRYDVAEP
jgi:deoxyribodipyrimidine photo-lyase